MTDRISDALVSDVSAAFMLTAVFVILIEVVSLQFGRLVFRCVEGAEKNPQHGMRPRTQRLGLQTNGFQVKAFLGSVEGRAYEKLAGGLRLPFRRQIGADKAENSPRALWGRAAFSRNHIVAKGA